MNPVKYFNNDCWDIVGRVDREREALLNREHKEVYHEMIFQEHLEGKKSSQQIADDYHDHKYTVCRIARMKRSET